MLVLDGALCMLPGVLQIRIQLNSKECPQSGLHGRGVPSLPLRKHFILLFKWRVHVQTAAMQRLQHSFQVMIFS